MIIPLVYSGWRSLGKSYRSEIPHCGPSSREDLNGKASTNDLRSIKEGVGQFKEEIGRLGKRDKIDLLKSNNDKAIKVEALDSRLERLGLEKEVKSQLDELGDPRRGV